MHLNLRHPLRLKKSHSPQTNAPHLAEIGDKPPVEEPLERRGLEGAVRFFVDRAISIAVMSVTRKHCHRSRLTVVCKNGISYHVTIFASTQQTETGLEEAFIAHSNDMCFFTGETPSLYVVYQSARELESAIYLYLTDRLITQDSVRAQIYRERGDVDMPILEGTSDEGPASFQAKVGFISL
jgi:hypothetical protein